MTNFKVTITDTIRKATTSVKIIEFNVEVESTVYQVAMCGDEAYVIIDQINMSSMHIADRPLCTTIDGSYGVMTLVSDAIDVYANIEKSDHIVEMLQNIQSSIIAEYQEVLNRVDCILKEHAHVGN